MERFKGFIKRIKFILWIFRTYILKYIYERPMIVFISKMGKRNLVGVEIGVYKGDNAYFILKNLSIRKLFLIDPYLEYKEYKGQFGWTEVEQPVFDKHFAQAQRKVKEFGKRAIFIRKKSEDAVSDVPDKLDFVYIDGNHDYEFVKQDIELYYPRLERGGYLAVIILTQSIQGWPVLFWNLQTSII